MSAPDVHSRILAGLKGLLELPVLGAFTRAAIEALDLEPLLPDIMAALIEKSGLTVKDNQLHSKALITPGPAELMVVVNVMAWPTTLSESRDEAREKFFSLASVYTAGAVSKEFAGFAQLDAFLGGTTSAELRFAWLPLPANAARLTLPLQRTLLPWGTEPRPVKESVAPATGSDIVELARSTAQMIAAMRELLTAWPDEDYRPAPSFSHARDKVSSLVPIFNAAVERLGLGHLMPVSKWDDTWKPHNLKNSLRFHSVSSSLEADLLRVWGKQVRDDFSRAFHLFFEAPRESAQDPLIASIARRSLERHPVPSIPTSTEPLDAFVSYAWADKTRGARDVYEAIRAAGHTAWLDEEQRPQEAALNEDIEAALLHCGRIVICVSLEMFTRGGYALREMLLALSLRRARCLLVPLDNLPMPSSLEGIPTIEWDRDGTDKLTLALQEQFSDEPAPPLDPGAERLKAPFLERLVAPLRRQNQPRRNVRAPDRVQELSLRAKLFRALLSVFHALEDDNMDQAITFVEREPQLLAWASFSGRASREDPTVFAAALRLRSGLFRAHVQLGAGRDFKRHNFEAFQHFDAILSLDSSMLRPAPTCGWLVQDCRLAVQDCLDVFAFSEDWFRGWTPDSLQTLGVPAERVFRIQERIAERVALLAERMLALRSWEEAAILREATPSWRRMWSTLAEDLRSKLHVGAHPGTRAYFEELGRQVSPHVLDQVAVALSDGAIESALGSAYREELFFDLGAFRLRCIIRSYCSPQSKRESLASVRGTVLNDLRGQGSEQADLNILFSLFFRPRTDNADEAYGLFMNIYPSENAGPTRLPRILTNRFLMAEMLSDSEREQNAALGAEIYEEL